jgi:hypothetical protein
MYAEHQGRSNQSYGCDRSPSSAAARGDPWPTFEHEARRQQYQFELLTFALEGEISKRLAARSNSTLWL